MVQNGELETDMSYNEHRANLSVSRYTPSGVSAEFVRDVDKLWVEYRALRLSTKKRLMNSLGHSDSQELDGYINDAFVTLIKEYQPQSGIDLPGYLKRMLYTRARYLFVRPVFVRYSKEALIDSEEILDTLDEAESNVLQYDTEITDNFLSYVKEKISLTPAEELVVDMVIVGRSNTEVYKVLSKEFDIKRPHAVEVVAQVREMLKNIVFDFLS